MRKLLIIGAVIGMLYSCNTKTNNSYSFFVAGHTYGSPMAANPGLHPPFIGMFSWLNESPDIEFGIFTGDIVRNSTETAWDSVDSQLTKLDKTVYFCPGNHDVKPRELYASRYGDAYYSFIHKNGLFVILDGNSNRWNIKGPQLEFLKNTLNNAVPDISNVFVFVHQLIWWDESNIFSQINLNWPPYTPDTTNYWSEVEPILQNYHLPVFIFAGDLGANRQASALMYYPDGNVTYIASGMGNIDADNFIIVKVDADNEVRFEVIALGDDKNNPGRLEDHLLQ
ncbi:MAG: metallophosphoesterase [Bacteroidota bacterium]|nr:metallophosphoesterase [Bacteroidota bacterium]